MILPARSLARVAVLTAMVLTAWPSGGSAASAPGAKVPKIAVLEMRAVGSFDPKSVAGLSSLIASEAARFPVKVIAGSDLQSLMGFERQKQLLGCSDSSCLAEIGGGLGVDYLLTSEVGEVAGRWLLTVTLLDVAKATATKRLTKKTKDQGELVDLTGVAVEEILQVLFAPKAAAPEPPKPIAVEAAKVEPAKLETPPAALPPAEGAKPAAAVAPVPDGVTKESPSGSGKIAGYALIGSGIALLAGGAVTGVLALNEKAEAATRRDNGTATQEELDAFKSSIDTKNLVANILYGAGAVAAGVGLFLTLTSSSAPDAPPAKVGLAPLVGGGAIVVSGGF